MAQNWTRINLDKIENKQAAALAQWGPVSESPYIDLNRSCKPKWTSKSGRKNYSLSLHIWHRKLVQVFLRTSAQSACDGVLFESVWASWNFCKHALRSCTRRTLIFSLRKIHKNYRNSIIQKTEFSTRVCRLLQVTWRNDTIVSRSAFAPTVKFDTSGVIREQGQMLNGLTRLEVYRALQKVLSISVQIVLALHSASYRLWFGISTHGLNSEGVKYFSKYQLKRYRSIITWVLKYLLCASFNTFLCWTQQFVVHQSNQSALVEY